jgi:hypothetical protein
MKKPQYQTAAFFILNIMVNLSNRGFISQEALSQMLSSA